MTFILLVKNFEIIPKPNIIYLISPLLKNVFHEDSKRQSIKFVSLETSSIKTIYFEVLYYFNKIIKKKNLTTS